MKNLKDYLNVNESLLGVAGGVVAGLIGFKVLQGIIRGIVGSGAKVLLNAKLEKDAQKLENDWIPRLEELLQAHPNSYKWINEYYQKTNVKDTLRRVNNTLGAVSFVENCISKDEWSQEDAQEFKMLWDKAYNTNHQLWDKMCNDLMASLK